jgi:hypothetical protein
VNPSGHRIAILAARDDLQKCELGENHQASQVVSNAAVLEAINGHALAATSLAADAVGMIRNLARDVVLLDENLTGGKQFSVSCVSGVA